MKTEELFEAAQLDALGLLDEKEQAEFEAAFRAASPALREQIRAEQDRFARPERFRLDVTPAADLRSRVIKAVMSDMAQVAGTIRRSHAAGRELPTVHPVRRVSPVWRVATLACATMAIVLAVVTLQQNAQMTSLQVALGNDRTIDKLVELFGPADLTKAVFSASTNKLVFSPADASVKGDASLFYDKETQSARLLCRNIVTNPNETVRLVATDDSGKIVQIAEFASAGELITKKVDMGGLHPKQLAIYVASRGTDASTGRKIMVCLNA